MKKIFTLVLLISATMLVAQNADKSRFRSPVKFPSQTEDRMLPSSSDWSVPETVSFSHDGPAGRSIVHPIAIGQAGNAWGFAYMRTTFLWAVNDVNSVTFIHRMLATPGDGINDVKVAFAPDGMTGWICVMSDRLPALPYTSYHPILLKTTDGGQTWSDPIEVQLGGMSHYVFAEVTGGGNYDCTIPFVYEQLTDEDVAAPVQFWYIPDFEQSYVVMGMDDQESGPVVTDIRNFPNPFRDYTYININLLQACAVNVVVYNTLGQAVGECNFGMLDNGPHRLTLHLESLDEGVYFYTLQAGN
ncbi:MAG: T9SS C-terminal target domain-containing protein [Bacteroidetes bacterium]|nr:MAG: T9SS C-terminal target domain-containing protein [Bacteroidota bacterium]